MLELHTPFAVALASCEVAPRLQEAVPVIALTTGSALTVTKDVAVAVQPLLAVPVTVYVVVVIGEAVTEAVFVALNPVLGDQL